ncbi:hypothetical protein OHA79_29710 [Streptomyces sp. NBC_00841]|uniref:hypothetical protein n=1 Tax=unclassified Streptomyces TaxID=2593676 RepID=UPI00224D6D79|nr:MULTISPECIES: hypothetical protein [unclassified Streptomyces]MCX4532889.1 hypothetical protein [Streptomyces sp. NBC_01669]WSA01654.1 hypothetical protein OHA79_29710 [Streptomyces sp. NBC_00841]
MTRKRPGALRAAQQRTPGWLCKPGRIHRLSLSAGAAIRRVEHDNNGYTAFPGATAVALRHIHSSEDLRAHAVPQPRRLPLSGLLARRRDPCQDALGDVLALLPPRPQAELGRPVARIDRELLRRTLPDPRAPGHPWRREAWWRMRVHDEVIDPPQCGP